MKFDAHNVEVKVHGFTCRPYHGDDFIILDDPWPEKSLSKRQQWIERRWLFRTRMRIRKVIKQRMRRATKSNAKAYYMGIKPDA